MTGQEMVRELVDKYGYTRYRLAKEGMAGMTHIWLLYEGKRGDCMRPATLAKMKPIYERLKKEAKAKGEA